MSFCPTCGARFRAASERPKTACPLDGTALVAEKKPGDPQDPLLGRTLGSFTVVAPLAEGKTSRLFLAKTAAGSECVLKVLDGQLCEDRELAARYASAASLAELRDPEFFVRVLGSGTTEHGLVYLAMERFSGKTLEARLREGPINESEATQVAAAVAEALATLHRRARGYGALEPRKVLLETDADSGGSRVRLLDASASRALLPPLSPPPSPSDDMRALGALIRGMVQGPPDAPMLALAARLEGPEDDKGLSHADAFLAAMNKKGSGVVLSRPPTPAASEAKAASERPVRAPSLRPASVVAPVKTGPGPARILMAVGAAVGFVLLFLALTRGGPKPEVPPVEAPGAPEVAEAPAPLELEPEPTAPAPSDEPPAPEPAPAPVPAAAKPTPDAAVEARFLELDARLGEALAARGLSFEDLKPVESNRTRQWGRWYRKAERPTLEALERTHAALVAAIDRAASAKQAKLEREKAAAKRAARPAAPQPPPATSTSTDS